jgi:hypothetical protein
MSDPSLRVNHRPSASHRFGESQTSRSSLQRLEPIAAPSPKDLRSIDAPKSKILGPKSLTWVNKVSATVFAAVDGKLDVGVVDFAQQREISVRPKGG